MGFSDIVDNTDTDSAKEIIETKMDAARAAAEVIGENTEVHRAMDERLVSGDMSPDELKEYTAAELIPKYLDGNPVWKDWDTRNAIQDGLKKSVWVYACVERLSSSAAAAKWEVYRKTGDGKEPAFDSDLQQLLDKPNPAQTQNTIIQTITSHLNLGGNALLSVVEAAGQPQELWVVDPAETDPIPTDDPGKWLSHYEYEKGGTYKEFEPESIIHFQFPDPENQFWGMSPLKAAAKAVDIEVEAEDFQKVTLQNRMVSDGAIAYDKPLTQDQFEDAKEQIDEHEPGEAMVFGNEARWIDFARTPAEMDFVESRKGTRNQICSAFSVPQPLVGVYENATLANIQTARMIFWQGTVIPYLDDLKATLNLSLAPKFGDEYMIDYNIKHLSVLLDVVQKKINIAVQMWDRGVPWSVLDQYFDLGLPDFPGKELSFVPGAQQLRPSSNQEPFGGE